MHSSKTAIIVGHRGQDGTLLSANLSERGYEIIGIGRSESSWGGVVSNRVVDVGDPGIVRQLLGEVGPCDIYYLAAYHSSSERSDAPVSQAELFTQSQAVHVTGLLNFLSAMVEVIPQSRLFYAASSLVFSGKHGEVQDEETPLEPVGMYGITKAQGMWLCREFREKQKIFAACGILYNHESYLRPCSFLTTKIIQAAINIAAGGADKLEVGRLSAKVDWGYAADYVNAFRAILALDSPDDFIMATGKVHSVEQFIEAVFGYFSLDWREHVVVNQGLLFREQPVKRGNPSKLQDRTGIALSRPFSEFVRMLIEDHLQAKPTLPSRLDK